MKVQLGPEVQKDPEGFLYAYTYGPDGFYVGMCRMQEDQLNPGKFLLPRSSTRERPQLKEGFIPRWNGQSWDLIEKKAGVRSASENLSEREKVQAQMFDSVLKNALDVVKSECQRFGNGLEAAFQADIQAQRMEMRYLVSVEAEKVLSGAVRAIVADVKVLLQGDVAELRELARSSQEEVRNLLKVIEDSKESSRAAVLQIQDLMKKETLPEKRSLWSRITGQSQPDQSGSV